MGQALLSFSLVWLVFWPDNSPAQPLKGKIQGASHVNLRSGPHLSQAAISVLREGDEVLIDREERGWYLVSLADGRKGYVYKTFVGASSEIAETRSPDETSAELGSERKNDAAELVSRQPVEKARPSKRKRLPLVQLLWGREEDILWWLGVTTGIFILGWICGGNYYLRRDRIRRQKLRF